MSPSRQTFLILGATGDLTARLLLLGLGGLLTIGDVEDLQLIGSAVDDWDDERWRSQIAESSRRETRPGTRPEAVAKGAHYVRADVTGQSDLRRLLEQCRTG